MVGMFRRTGPPPRAARRALAALVSTLHSTWLLRSLRLWLVHLDVLLEAGPVGGRDMWVGTRLLTALPGQWRRWGQMFCEGVYTHTHVTRAQDSSVWSGPSSLGSSPDSYRAPSPSACPTQCHAPVLVIGTFLVETFIMGLHVAQAGIVIGINKGQVNLTAETIRADIRGGIPGRKQPALADQPWRGEAC